MMSDSTDIRGSAISVERRSNHDNLSNETKKLSHLSFRLEKRVIEMLREEAMKRGISASGLVNKILKDYVMSEMYFEELGFILVSKDFLRDIFSNINEMKLEEIGRELGLKAAEEAVSYFYSVVNSENVVRFLDLLFRRFQSFQHRVDCRRESTNDDGSARRMSRHYFAVNHDINYNYSVLMRAMIEGLIEPIIKKEVEFKMVTANSLLFAFEVEEIL